MKIVIIIAYKLMQIKKNPSFFYLYVIWGSIKKGLHKHKQFLLELCLVQISNFWECNMKTVIKLVNKLIQTRHFHKHFVLTFGYEVWDGFKRLLQQNHLFYNFV